MTNFKEHKIFWNKINLELFNSSQNTLLVLFIFFVGYFATCWKCFNDLWKVVKIVTFALGQNKQENVNL